MIPLTFRCDVSYILNISLPMKIFPLCDIKLDVMLDVIKSLHSVVVGTGVIVGVVGPEVVDDMVDPEVVATVGVVV